MAAHPPAGPFDPTAPVDVGAVAGMTVLDEKGEKIVLGSLFEKSNALLCFIRHFG